MAYQAQDTFVAELDGGPVLIQKGTVLPSSHPAVRMHGKSALFAPMPMDDEDEAPKRSRRSSSRPGKDDAADGGDG